MPKVLARGRGIHSNARSNICARKSRSSAVNVSSFPTKGKKSPILVIEISKVKQMDGIQKCNAECRTVQKACKHVKLSKDV